MSSKKDMKVVIHSRSLEEGDEYFLSTDHMQEYHSPDTYPQGEWSSVTFHLPLRVVPRPSCLSGVLTTKEELKAFFFPTERCKEVPNPDPFYQG